MAAALRIVVVLSLLSPAPSVRAQPAEIQLPADLQSQLLSGVLGFDRNAARFGSEIVIGVLYQQENRESVSVFRSMTEALRVVASPNGATFRLEAIPMNGAELPAHALTMDVLYVAPLRRVDAGALLGAATESGVLTVTGVTDYARGGAAVGLMERDRRPTIVINMAAARAAGSDFSSQLLRLAEVRP